MTEKRKPIRLSGSESQDPVVHRYDFCDGKYSVILRTNSFYALRYGKRWRDLVGDNLVRSMLEEIFRLRAQWQDARTENACLSASCKAASDRIAELELNEAAIKELMLQRQDAQQLVAELQAELKDRGASSKVLTEVAQERARQHSKWDGVFDDTQYSPGDWHAMITDYSAWARRMACMGSPDKARRRYIQIAALAVAAVEAGDEKAAAATGEPVEMRTLRWPPVPFPVFPFAPISPAIVTDAEDAARYAVDEKDLLSDVVPKAPPAQDERWLGCVMHTGHQGEEEQGLEERIVGVEDVIYFAFDGSDVGHGWEQVSKEEYDTTPQEWRRVGLSLSSQEEAIKAQHELHEQVCRYQLRIAELEAILSSRKIAGWISCRNHSFITPPEHATEHATEHHTPLFTVEDDAALSEGEEPK